jgi:hypothetical protein
MFLFKYEHVINVLAEYMPWCILGQESVVGTDSVIGRVLGTVWLQTCCRSVNKQGRGHHHGQEHYIWTVRKEQTH